ncbi:MAG: hypothetical protein GXO32_05760 [Crenarchaeota archaeon]|nr:hypothetical protein [Thermoproteota archaeon]
MSFKDLERLGYTVKESEVRERSLLGEEVRRRTVIVEGRDATLRLSQLGSRYRVVVVTGSEAKELLEGEGMDVSELGDDTILASASFRSVAEASMLLRRIASRLATRR